MSDTPRTDFVAHAKAWANGAKDKIVQLERELAEAKAEIVRLKGKAELWEGGFVDQFLKECGK